LFARWRAPRPGRVFKIATALVAAAGAAAAFVATRGAVAEMVADSQDEATALLQKIATEPPIDMARFDRLPAEGPADARVTIVVASDFQCSFCRNLAARLDELRAEYPRDVRILFLNAPISSKCNPSIHEDTHEHACWLARAGACAERQGRFWPYHDLVYRELSPIHVDERGVRRALARAGLDAVRLDACLAGADADSVVARDVRLWRELGMNSVPSIVINGHVKTGGIYPTTLRTVVRTLLSHPA
jgi:protein-disulfide isomerase